MLVFCLSWSRLLLGPQTNITSGPDSGDHRTASPWQNGFVESFHGRFRDEWLNREQLWTLTEARVVIEDFRIDYNTRRPHSRLGYHSPVN